MSIEWFQLEANLSIGEVRRCISGRNLNKTMMCMLGFTRGAQARDATYGLYEIAKYEHCVYKIEPSYIKRTVALRVTESGVYWSIMHGSLTHATHFIIVGDNLRLIFGFIRSNHPNWYLGARSTFTCRELRAIQRTVPDIVSFYINLARSPALTQEIEELYYQCYAVRVECIDTDTYTYTTVATGHQFDPKGAYVAFIKSEMANAYRLLLEVSSTHYNHHTEAADA
jgi:hypothetical protein